jgi:hypothetical protein
MFWVTRAGVSLASCGTCADHGCPDQRRIEHVTIAGWTLL